MRVKFFDASGTVQIMTIKRAFWSDENLYFVPCEYDFRVLKVSNISADHGQLLLNELFDTGKLDLGILMRDLVFVE